MLETNPQDLSGRVEAAETAIYKRLQELLQDTNHHTERHVIEAAPASLKVLKGENPGLPDRERSDYAEEHVGCNNLVA